MSLLGNRLEQSVARNVHSAMRFNRITVLFTFISMMLSACGEQSSAGFGFVQEMPELHKRKTQLVSIADLPSADFLDVRYPENPLVLVVTKSKVYVDPPAWMMQHIRRYKRHSSVAAPPFSISLQDGRFEESELRDGEFGLLIYPLYDALKELYIKAPSVRTKGVLIYAANDVEWSQIRKIRYTIVQAQFPEVGLFARSGNEKFVIPLSMRSQLGVGGEWNAWWDVLRNRVIQSHNELVVWPQISISQEGISARLYEGGPPIKSDDAVPSIFKMHFIEKPQSISTDRFVLPSYTYAYEEIEGKVQVLNSTRLCRTKNCIVATAHQGEIETRKGEELLIHSDSPDRYDELRMLISQIQQVAPRVLPPSIHIDEEMPLSSVAPILTTVFRQTGRGRINCF